MEKDLNYLQKLKKKLNPTNAMGGLLEGMLPKLGESIAGMEKSREEGGVLPDGFEKIGYLIVQAEGKVKITVCPLRQNGEVLEVGMPLSSVNIKDLL